MAGPVTTGGAGTSASPFVLQSGQSNITLAAGLFYVLQSGATLSGVTLGGGNLTVANGATLSGGATLNGGSLDLQATSTVNGKITFATTTSANPNKLVIEGTASNFVHPGTTYLSSSVATNVYTFKSIANAQVVGFGLNDTISVPNVTLNSASGKTAGLISGGNGTPANGELFLGITTGPSNTAVVIIPIFAATKTTQGYAFTGSTFQGCFLPGTHIATPGGGEVAVEDLCVHDAITVLVDGAPVARAIKWIGIGHMNAADKELSAYPVRIKAGAFAPNMPHRDLLLTNEHCIYIDQSLIPVRMLVNGQSIAYAQDLPVYAYYHIELEQHGVILSEGLTTESYLSGTNRQMFDNVATAPTPAGTQALAAPLATDRNVVEPIWNRLLQHGRRTGLAPLQTVRLLHDDNNLRLMLDDGAEIAGNDRFNDMYFFRVPNGRRPVTLLSNTATPADVFGPFLDDRRVLGVGVSQIHWTQSGKARTIGASQLDLPGWHALEGDRRWTNGAAQLDLPCAGLDGAELRVNVAMKIKYPAGILQGKAAA